MLASVFIICSCFVTYISRVNWEKAAKEVIQALTGPQCPAGMRQAQSHVQCCPCIQLPPAPALSGLELSPCTLFGDTNFRADWVTQAASALQP